MRKSVAELRFPVLLECRKYTTETFWYHVFEDLAYNKPPAGVFFSNNHICFNSKTKSKKFSYYISNDDVETLYKDIYKLLKENVGLLSPNEILETNSKMKGVDFMNSDWLSIRKKNIKDMFIQTFVIEQKQKYNLTIPQARDLMDTLRRHFTFKTLNINNILFEKGKIKNIEGLRFTDRNFIIDIKDNSKDLSDDKPMNGSTSEFNFLIESWISYLSNLNKLRKKNEL